MITNLFNIFDPSTFFFSLNWFSIFLYLNFLPYNVTIRFLITSSDVIHAWTIPSLGLKIDAVPGRLNQLTTIISRPGLYFGQCSEICGANHSFIPIVLEVTSLDIFIEWITSLYIEWLTKALVS